MIKLKNLTKSFGKKHILQGVDLTIETGEKIAIIGRSGCGKSTLLRLMMGLQKPDTGTVEVDGCDLDSLTESELKSLRMKFGMLFQSAALFDSMNVEENVAFTLVENLKLHPKLITNKVNEKLELVEMTGSEKLMPSDLSGGMKKRIGLARAIAADPEIVLYDEPTTGLDPVLSTNIEDLIVKLSAQMNVTSIVVTHQISTIMRTADKIYMLHKGKMLPPETPATIRQSQNEVIRHFISGGLET